MKIEFLFGTESGTAEIVCEDLEVATKGRAETSIQSLEDIDPESLSGDVFYVVSCSTYGSGDIPATAQEFYEKLTTDKPDLSHVRFAIFGLGDRTFYGTFCEGSEKIMNALKDCGATQVGERGISDAATGAFPEEDAVVWIEDIYAELGLASA
ncbi:MAG: flavodoxin domain-containing protein [Pseudomonadota bacterium]